MKTGKDKKTVELVCIECPLGCRIDVDGSGKELKISGAGCKKGKEFARDESFDPKRILTTTVAIDSTIQARLPVRSDRPAPKEKIAEMVSRIKDVKVSVPVKMGDVIAEDFLSTGVNVIASMDLER